jgi:carbamoyltransferase
MFSRGEGVNLKPLKRIKLPHSLGQFYSAVTNFIGFDMFSGDEWKLMGLAAYGEPKYKDFFSQRVLSANGNGDFHSEHSHARSPHREHYQFPAD